MTTPPAAQRRAFVHECQMVDDVVVLGTTRTDDGDDYRTVLVATLTDAAATNTRNGGVEAGYSVVTPWETSLFRFLAFTTAPAEARALTASSTPPAAMIDATVEQLATDTPDR